MHFAIKKTTILTMASFENFDDDRDQIYISGLPRDVTEDQLASHFGQIGTIKLDKKKRPPTPKARIGVLDVAGNGARWLRARHPQPSRTEVQGFAHPPGTLVPPADLVVPRQGHRAAEGRRHHHIRGPLRSQSGPFVV